MTMPVIRGEARFPARKKQTKLAKRNAFCPITGSSYDDGHSPRMSLACGQNSRRMETFILPNPGDELLESLHLEAAELFPELICGFPPRLSVESSVNKAN